MGLKSDRFDAGTLVDLRLPRMALHWKEFSLGLTHRAPWRLLKRPPYVRRTQVKSRLPLSAFDHAIVTSTRDHTANVRWRRCFLVFLVALARVQDLLLCAKHLLWGARAQGAGAGSKFGLLAARLTKAIARFEVRHTRHAAAWPRARPLRCSITSPTCITSAYLWCRSNRLTLWLSSERS